MIWMTTEETAEYLRLHKHTVYDYIKRKKIPAVKFGRHYRIPKEKLDETLLKEEFAEPIIKGRRPSLKYPL